MLKKSLVSWFLLLCVAFAPAGLSAEAEAAQPLRYSEITQIAANIYISNGKVNYTGSASGGSADTQTKVTVTLYRRAHGNSAWAYVEAWSNRGSGTAVVTVQGEKAVSSGYDYRIYVRCVIYAADGTQLESGGQYSSIQSY